MSPRLFRFGCLGLLVLSAAWMACGSSNADNPTGPAGPGDELADASPGSDAGTTGDGGADAALLDPAGKTAPPCSVDGWCWAWPSGVGSDFEHIDGTSDSDMWLSGPFPLLHYDGKAFRSFEEIPATFRSGALAVVATNDAWLFPGFNSYNDGYHWDGAKWNRVQSLPFSETTQAKVFGDTIVVAAFDVHVKRGAAAWTEEQTRLYGQVVSVAGTGPNDLWAATKNAVSHFDGTAWTARDVAGITISTIEATSDGVWLGGSDPDIDGTAPMVGRPTGATWELTKAPYRPGQFSEMRAVSSTDVVAVGPTEGGAHWDGTKWTFDASDATSSLRAVWKSPSGKLWAAGGGGRLQHRTASSWSRVSGRADGRSFRILDMWASSASDLWAVGSSFPRDGKTTLALLLHFDGTGFKEEPSPPAIGAHLESVSGSSPTNVWAAGERDLLRFDGTQWTSVPVPSPGTHTLRSILVSGTNDVWVMEAGNGPATTECRLNHFDGASWTPTPGVSCSRSTPAPLAKFGPNEIWLAFSGYNFNRIARWNGSTWAGAVNFEDRPGNFFRLDADNAWFASGRDLYRHNTTPTAWEKVTTLSSTSRVDSVHAFAPSDVWITSNTDVRRWEGASWASQRTGLQFAQASLWPPRIWGASPKDVWLLNTNGLLRRQK